MDLTDEQRRANVLVHDAVDWDSRKHLLDIWQDAGGPMPAVGVDWDETIYPALMAVASWGARQVVQNELL
jgi:hypothetical protein